MEVFAATLSHINRIKSLSCILEIVLSMHLPSSEILQSLDGRAASMLALVKKQDVESLATSSAKRRFFRVELEVAGIDPDHISAELIEAAVNAKCTDLAVWLGSLKKLGEYARSEERQKFNPEATNTDLASQVPIASDWFLQSSYLAEWDDFDFLSRCESIWKENGFTGEGMLFTRIFDYRVKMLAGYEDGLRLVMLLAEVGEYVKPVELTTPKEVRIESVDLVRRMGAYDGPPPSDWYAPVQVPMGKADWAFSLAEVEENKFEKLKDKLGQENFDKIMETQGYVYPNGPFETYRGEDKLPLYYYTRKSDQADTTELVIVSSGEYQPGRLKAHVEGFWRVIGGNF